MKTLLTLHDYLEITSVNSLVGISKFTEEIRFLKKFNAQKPTSQRYEAS